MPTISPIPMPARPRDLARQGDLPTAAAAGSRLNPMRGPDRRTYQGRELVTRTELARISGEHERTLAKWYAARGRNGHPEGILLEGRVYLDEQLWRSWRDGHAADRRVINGRVMVSRVELARVTGQPTSTLARWYAERASNGHPEGERLDKRLYVDEKEWQRWHRDHQAALKTGLTEIDRSGDPDELLNATETARLLGYSSAATVTSYVNRGQFIEPDQIEEISSRHTRRWWRRRRIWEWADGRTWARTPSDTPPQPAEPPSKERGASPPF